MSDRNKYRYCQYFCEENIYWLTWDLWKEGRLGARAGVIFVSNPLQRCRMKFQRLGRGEEHVVFWDYHVILFDGKGYIWDFDSLCDFPCKFEDYFRCSFGDGEDGMWSAYFRLFDCNTYLEGFSSERSHNVGDGENEIVYPEWDKILKGDLSLERILDWEDESLEGFINLLKLRQILSNFREV